MSKSIKLKNSMLISSQSVAHGRKLLFDLLPTTIYTGKLYGGQSITLSGVKKKLIIYARANSNDCLVYTIDIDSVTGTSNHYGGASVVAWDSANSSEFYLSESIFNSNNNLFSHQRTGYINMVNGVYTSRNNGTQNSNVYYIYRIDTKD